MKCKREETVPVTMSNDVEPAPICAEVCKARVPPCPSCKGDLHFVIVEGTKDKCLDIIRWFCKKCSYHSDVEIL